MFETIATIAVLTLIAAGFCLLVGARCLGGKLALAAIAGLLLLGALNAVSAHCPQHSLMWLIPLVLLVVLLVFFWRFRLLFRLFGWLVKAVVIVNYRIGAWCAERLFLRFPVVLLPLPIKPVVQLACVALPLSLAATIALIMQANWQWQALLWAVSPVLVILGVGNLGKLVYRRREHKGLAHV